MLKRFLPHRDEALRAVALVATRGEPLAPGLARLAASDRLLGAWARRLVRAAERSARAGAGGAGTVLRRAGLLAADEAAFVDEAERGGDAGAALRHLAMQGGFRIPGLNLVEWFPLWLLGALLAAVLGMNLFCRFLGYDRIIRGIGLRTTWPATLVLDAHPIELFVPAVVLLLIVWSLLMAAGFLPGILALVRRVWYLPIASDAGLLRILRLARQHSAVAHLGTNGPERTWRRADCLARNQWLRLFGPGLHDHIRDELRATVEPADMLRRVGILPRDREPTAEEWEEVLDQTLRTLRSKLAPRLFIYRFLLVVSFGLMWLFLFQSTSNVLQFF